MEVPLPETIVTDELNARRQSIEQQLVYAGMTMEAYLFSGAIYWLICFALSRWSRSLEASGPKGH